MTKIHDFSPIFHDHFDFQGFTVSVGTLFFPHQHVIYDINLSALQAISAMTSSLLCKVMIGRWGLVGGNQLTSQV